MDRARARRAPRRHDEDPAPRRRAAARPRLRRRRHTRDGRRLPPARRRHGAAALPRRRRGRRRRHRAAGGVGRPDHRDGRRVAARPVEAAPRAPRRRAPASRRGAPRGPHTRRSAAPRPSIPQHIAVLAESCRDAAAVRFDYRARDGTPSRRRVEPNALVTVRSVWYLVGFDLDRDDWRMFRVDRVTGDVERTGHGATRRTVPGGDPLAYVGRSLADMPHAHHADIDLAVPGPTALAANAWLNPRRVEADGTRSVPDPPGDRRPRRAHPPGGRSPRRRPGRADRGRGRRARAPRRRRPRARQQLIGA